MADLWEAMRDPDLPGTSSFEHLTDLFFESAQFKALSKDQHKNHKNTYRIIALIPSTKDLMLNETNPHHWKPPLMQKVIDKIAADTPTTAHRAKEDLSRLFKWAIARGHIESNPAQYIELPKLQSKQRLPSKQLVSALLTFSKKRSNRKSRTLASPSPPHNTGIARISVLKSSTRHRHTHPHG